MNARILEGNGDLLSRFEHNEKKGETVDDEEEEVFNVKTDLKKRSKWSG